MTEIRGDSAGKVWLQAIRLAAAKSSHKVQDLTITIDRSAKEADESDLQRAVNDSLLSDGKPRLCTVANTIFPSSLWRDGMSRDDFYARYLELWPRIQAKKGNSRGTYFKRLIDYPGPNGSRFNQVEHVIRAYQKNIRRRSTLQCAVINPALDLRATPYQGFPCLQQLAFQPSNQGLRVVAFYPTQYLWRRAYGNYLGLLALGGFVAQQLHMNFEGLTCISLSAQLEGPAKASLLKPLINWGA